MKIIEIKCDCGEIMDEINAGPPGSCLFACNGCGYQLLVREPKKHYEF